MYLGIIDVMMEDIDRYGNSDFDFNVCEDGEFKKTPPLKRTKKLKRTSREPVVKKPVL